MRPYLVCENGRFGDGDVDGYLLMPSRIQPSSILRSGWSAFPLAYRPKGDEMGLALDGSRARVARLPNKGSLLPICLLKVRDVALLGEAGG